MSLELLSTGEQIGSVSVACEGEQFGDACGDPEPPKPGLRTSTGPGEPCLFWDDTYSGESGFRVELTYSRIGRVFAYFIPANNRLFEVPFEAAPQLSESGTVCLERKDSEVAVFVLFPDGTEESVGSRSFVAECR